MTVVATNPNKVDGHRPPLHGMMTCDALEADLPVIVEIFNAASSEPSFPRPNSIPFRSKKEWRGFAVIRPIRDRFWSPSATTRVAGWLSFHVFLCRAPHIAARSEISVYVSEQFRRAGLGRASAGEGHRGIDPSGNPRFGRLHLRA